MCTGKTIGLLVRRHIVAGEFHHIGKEASTRWGSGPDLSMMAEAGWLDPVDKTFREYKESLIRNIFMKSELQPSSFPRSSSLVLLPLQSAR